MVDEYVTSDDGTGIVHQAPAFGDEDHRIAVANGIIRAGEMPPCPIDDAGRFTKEVSDFEGQPVKVSGCTTTRFHSGDVLIRWLGCRQGNPEITQREG